MPEQRDCVLVDEPPLPPPPRFKRTECPPARAAPVRLTAASVRSFGFRSVRVTVRARGPEVARWPDSLTVSLGSALDAAQHRRLMLTLINCSGSTRQEAPASRVLIALAHDDGALFLCSRAHAEAGESLGCDTTGPIGIPPLPTRAGPRVRTKATTQADVRMEFDFDADCY